MKFYKSTLVVALMAAMAFTSCDNSDDYIPGAPAGEHNIGFSSQSNMTLGMEQKELTVELTRSNTTGELVVPIKPLIVPECLSMPNSATFADGSTTATIKITVGENMKPFTDYQLSFSIPEKYTNAYAEEGRSPIFNINVIKEDYRVVADGVYQGKVLIKEQWIQPVEYSPIQKLYRLPNCMAKGTHWYFLFDGDKRFSFANKDGQPVNKFLCGLIHTKYGSVSANVLPDNPIGYEVVNEDGIEGLFAFPLEYSVSAGNFGAEYEFLYITKWIEKPWTIKE